MQSSAWLRRVVRLTKELVDRLDAPTLVNDEVFILAHTLAEILRRRDGELRADSIRAMDDAREALLLCVASVSSKDIAMLLRSVADIEQFVGHSTVEASSSGGTIIYAEVNAGALHMRDFTVLEEVCPAEPASRNDDKTHDERVMVSLRETVAKIRAGAEGIGSILAEERHLIDGNTALMEKSLTATKEQTQAVNETIGIDRLGDRLASIPVVGALWAFALHPLWLLIRNALMVILIVGATVGTVSMMFLVPKAYVRERLIREVQ
jgi:hypothetical protein